MKKSVFCAEETELLNEMALLYYAMESGEKKDKLRGEIVERIQLLLYLAPKKYYYLPEDLCASFYLKYRDKSGEILDSYRLVHIPFLAYLIQTIKFRAQTHLKQEYKNISDERDLLMLQTGSYIEEMESSQEVFEPRIAYKGELQADELELQNLPIQTLFRRICDHKGREQYFTEFKLNNLYKILQSKHNRRSFLFYLLHSTYSFSLRTIEQASLLLDIDEAYLAILNVHLMEAGRENHLKHEEQIDITARHWKRLITIELALKSEERKTELETLTYLERITKERIEKCIARAHRHCRGLTIALISEFSGYSPSLISTGIHEMQSILESIDEGEEGDEIALQEKKKLTILDAKECYAFN